MRVRPSEYPADTCVIAPPAERAASSTRRNKSTLAALPIVDGSILIGLTIRAACVVKATTLIPPPP